VRGPEFLSCGWVEVGDEALRSLILGVGDLLLEVIARGERRDRAKDGVQGSAGRDQPNLAMLEGEYDAILRPHAK
jgi:hypothetical protein